MKFLLYFYLIVRFMGEKKKFKRENLISYSTSTVFPRNSISEVGSVLLLPRSRIGFDAEE